LHHALNLTANIAVGYRIKEQSYSALSLIQPTEWQSFSDKNSGHCHHNPEIYHWMKDRTNFRQFNSAVSTAIVDYCQMMRG
jgi:hypothetical protein